MPPNTDLHVWKPGEPIPAALLNELRNAIPDLAAGTGIEITELRGRTTIGLSARQPLPKQTFWARIVGVTPDSPNRWRYTIQETLKEGLGYGGWTTKPGGRTGTAYNLCEDMNDGSGVEGMGIDIDGEDFPAGYSVRPAPIGRPVKITIATTADGQVKEFWFDFTNPVDGTCEA